MVFFIINLIIFFILILFILHTIKYKNNLVEINKETIKKNSEYEHEKHQLMLDTVAAQANIDSLNAIKNNLEKEQKEELNKLNLVKEQVQEIQRNSENTAKESFSRYVDVLEKDFERVEKEYDESILKLKNSYTLLQTQISAEIEAHKQELNAIKETKAATLAAQLKEQEIKEKLDFYCLKPKKTDLNDIQVLETIKPRLTNPRILSMLIWSTYFQKDMTALCNNILGTKTIIGIYKITNQKNSKCYIGQSVDVSKRWKDHAKCGLGIDTPQGNKLYKEMQEIGIWNFSWELLEECPREQLNEKERYYIELYQSKDYGYNTVKGNN